MTVKPDPIRVAEALEQIAQHLRNGVHDATHFEIHTIMMHGCQGDEWEYAQKLGMDIHMSLRNPKPPQSIRSIVETL